MKIRMIWIIVMKKPRAKTPTRAICFFFIGVSLCVGGWWRGRLGRGGGIPFGVDAIGGLAGREGGGRL